MWRYNNLSEVQLALLNKNIIDLQGNIDSDMALYIREAITRLIAKGSPNITLRITSDGGNVRIGLDIYDLLEDYPGEITGFVIGFARSMAAIILQVCNNRIASKHSHILIHHINRGKITFDEIKNKQKLITIKKEMDNDQELLYDILIKKISKSRKTIIKACSKDKDMSTKAALKFGLIDKIV